jgi:hypothetical protein
MGSMYCGRMVEFIRDIEQKTNSEAN